MYQIRDYLPSDALSVNEIAVRAFAQYKDKYVDWPVFQSRIANMSTLADAGEIVVAEQEGHIVGAVAYIGPGKPKAEFFRPEWSIMRMLVVAPEARVHGIGRKLAQECINKAKRDGALIFALHTSEIMQIALSMYQRMGFRWSSSVPMIHGVKYNVYIKEIDD